MSLDIFLKKSAQRSGGFQPRIFNLSRARDRRALAALARARKIHRVSDDYEEQMREHFAVTHPSRVYAPDFEQRFREYKTEIEKRAPLWQQGRWVYFPWLGSAAHILEEKSFQIVRTARNRNLITKEEQEKFYNAVVELLGFRWATAWR